MIFCCLMSTVQTSDVVTLTRKQVYLEGKDFQRTHAAYAESVVLTMITSLISDNRGLRTSTPQPGFPFDQC